MRRAQSCQTANVALTYFVMLDYPSVEEYALAMVLEATPLQGARCPYDGDRRVVARVSARVPEHLGRTAASSLCSFAKVAVIPRPGRYTVEIPNRKAERQLGRRRSTELLHLVDLRFVIDGGWLPAFHLSRCALRFALLLR